MGRHLPLDRQWPRVWRERAVDGLFFAVGSGLYALSVECFSAPNRIVPGGVTGLATLAHHVWGWPIGTVVLALNVPLLLAAWRFLGIGYTVRTAVATGMASLALDVLEPFIRPFEGDRVLAAVFGGVLAGLGLGLIYVRGGTTGGSEIVAGLLARRWPHVPIGRLLLGVDAVVVLLSIAVYGQLESGLYAVVLIYLTSTLLDALVYGRDKGKLLLIVSSEAEALARDILTELRRGVTMLPAIGGYTGQSRRMLLCAVRPQEVFALRRLVRARDPSAFLIVTTADEVIGEGFKPIREATDKS